MLVIAVARKAIVPTALTEYLKPMAVADPWPLLRKSSDALELQRRPAGQEGSTPSDLSLRSDLGKPN